MILYAFFDNSAPHGQRVYTNLRKARQERAARFTRGDRPELLKIDIGPLNAQTACNLLSGLGYALTIEDIK